jgi:hypothetical protein
VELQVLALEAGFVGRCVRTPAQRPLHAGFDVEVEEEGKVRPHTAAGQAFERRDDLGTQLPAVTLIRGRGVVEAIRDDNPAGFESGEDDLLDVLGAGREVQEQLGNRPQVCRGGVQQNPADLPADARAPGLLRAYHLVAGCGEPLAEHSQLGGFAAAVDSFEGQKSARPGGHVTSIEYGRR